MADFVEQAILRLKDETSAPANKVNAALRSLWQTANRLKSTNINIGIKVGQTRSQVNALARDLERLTQGKRQLPLITVRVNSNQVEMAIQRLQQLRSLAGPLPSTRVPAGVNGGRSGSGVPIIPQGGRGNGSFAGLITQSLATAAAFKAVDVAARATAAALKAVADNAVKRDRTTLQSNVAATKSQRDLFDKLDAAIKPSDRSPLQLPKTLFDQLRTSLLGDVQGATPEERATGANAIARRIEKELIPTIYSLNPERGLEAAAAGARDFVKAMNLASSDMIDAAGNFTKDGERVWKGILLALRANPETQGQLAKTTFANAKNAGFTLSDVGLARLLAAAGDKGQRVGNETFQLIRSLSGGINNKTLNAALEAAGIVQGFQRAGKGSGHRAGSIIPGTGSVVDEALLRSDPGQWINKIIRPKIEEQIRKQFGEGADVNDPIKQTSAIDKLFPGMKDTARVMLTDLLLGFQQSQSTMQQAIDSQSNDVSSAIKQSWAAAAANVESAGKDAFGKLGDMFVQSLGGKAILDTITGILRGDYGTGAQVAGGAAAGVVGAVGAGGSAALGAFPLIMAGRGLNTAAANLNLAAARLGAAGVTGAAGNAAGGAGAAAGAAGAAGGFLRGAMRVAGWAAVATLATELALDYFGDQKIKKSVSDTVTGLTGTKLSEPTKVPTDAAEKERELTGLLHDRAETLTTIKRLEQELASDREKNKSGTFDPNAARKENELGGERLKLMSLDEQIAKLNEGTAALKVETETAKTNIVTATTQAGADAATTLQAAGTPTGDAIGAAMMPYGAAIGVAIGEAAAARIGSARVNVEVKAGPNVGTSPANK